MADKKSTKQSPDSKGSGTTKDNSKSEEDRFAAVKSIDESNPKLKIVSPKPRPEGSAKSWRDPKLFTNYSSTGSVKEASSTTVNPDEDQTPKDGSMSRAGRRLSLVTPVTERRASLPRESLTGIAPPRRDSLTPLAYFAGNDAAEQFIEQGAVTNSDVQDAKPEPAFEVEARESAEHFKLPRTSIAGGIKIEITPPSALKEVNTFILETVVLEVPIDNETPSLDAASRVFVVSQLTKSSTEVPDIGDVIDNHAEAVNNGSSENGTVTPTQSIHEVTKKDEPPKKDIESSSSGSSLQNMAPPPRRRTKLIAINVRRQTLSAVPRVAKTVRFAPSPTRGTEHIIQDVEMEDRTPHIWTDEKAQQFGEPEELAMEVDEPLTPTLMKSSDFSPKELECLKAKKDRSSGQKFVEEREVLNHFLESKYPDAHRKPLHPSDVKSVGSNESASAPQKKMKTELVSNTMPMPSAVPAIPGIMPAMPVGGPPLPRVISGRRRSSRSKDGCCSKCSVC